jgi:hypothetical protein
VCAAGGLIGLLGGAKRRMLSFAERLLLFEALLPLGCKVAGMMADIEARGA